MFLETILHFDIAALFLFAITIFYVIYRKSYRAYSSLIFLVINVMYFIVCVIDITISSGILPIIPEKIGMFAYYLLKYQTSILYLLYIVIITNSEDVIRNRKKGLLFSIPFFITLGFLIANIFTGHIYYFDGDVYKRGDYIFVFYGLSFIYVVVGLGWIIRFIKAFRFNEIFALLSVYVLSIAALITQYFYPDALIELLASSISFILLSITIERSQLIVDQRTGLKNGNLFKKLMFIIFKRKKEIGLIIFYIKNYMILYEKYNYDVALKNIKRMTSYLAKAFASEISYECYYLGDGTIALTTSNLEEAQKLANLINSFMLNPDYDKVGFNIDGLLCVSSVPSDFGNLSEFNKFMSEVVDSELGGKKLINVSNIKNDLKQSALFDLYSIISRAIKEKDIDVEFQPVYNLKQKKYTVVEVFCKINDEKFGLLNSKSFISFAEKRGLIYDIDLLVIEKIFKSYYDYKFESLGINNIAINVSAKTLANPNFIGDLKKLENQYTIQKNKIYFEVKEIDKGTFSLNVYSAVKSMMDDGYIITLNNYGIGSMPVQEFARIPFKHVKFDGSFAKKCDKKETAVILENTIKLLKRLKKISVITGVETEEEASILESLNPDYLQGDYYSKTFIYDELVDFLKEKKNC